MTPTDTTRARRRTGELVAEAVVATYVHDLAGGRRRSAAPPRRPRTGGQRAHPVFRVDPGYSSLPMCVVAA